MYTQCPDCATVFRVTAEALRIAQGDVRCGVCSTSFNALENLSEQAFKAATEDEAPVAGRLDDGRGAAGQREHRAVGAGRARRCVPDLHRRTVRAREATPRRTSDEERAMEFHGDAADLDRLFVVENRRVEPFDPGRGRRRSARQSPSIDLDSTDEHPILVLDETGRRAGRTGRRVHRARNRGTGSRAPPPPPPPRLPPPAPRAPPAPPPPDRRAVASAHTAPRILIPDEMRKRLAEEAAARAAAVGGLRARRIARLPVAALALGRRRRGARVPARCCRWSTASATRSSRVRLGPAVAGVYAFLGLTVLAPTDLSAYELRQWGAASDPNEANRLMLRASIVNRATYAQPFPLLRLTLQDRFGGTLGMRDIGPADYLPGAGGAGLLGPGERADALIRIVDPGDRGGRIRARHLPAGDRRRALRQPDQDRRAHEDRPLRDRGAARARADGGRDGPAVPAAVPPHGRRESPHPRW